MADDYVIRARIVVDDSKARVGAQRVKKEIKEVEEQAVRSGASIGSIFGKMFAVAGGVYGLKQVAGGILGIHTEVQNAEGSLTTLLSALGGISIGEALPIAREQVKLLTADAATGVGGLADYQEAFTRLLGPARAAGAELEQVRKLTKLGITAGFALGGTQGARLLPGDIVQALTGGAGEIATKQLNVALNAIGLTTTEFNKLNKAARLVKLEEALGGFAAGAELMGQGWEAQTETFADGLKAIVRTLTRPLFERWTGSLRKANDWLEANRDTLAETAEVAGVKMLKLWDHLIKKASVYATIVAAAAAAQHLPPSLGATGRSRAGSPGGGGFGDIMKGVYTPEKRGTSAGKDLFGKRRTKSRIATAGAFAPMAPFKALLGVVTKLAAPVAILSAVFLAAKSALSAFPSLMEGFREDAAALFGSFEMLGAAFSGLTDQGSLLSVVGWAIIRPWVGIGKAMSYVIRGIALVIESFNLLGSVIYEWVARAGHTIRMLKAWATGDMAGGRAAAADFDAARAAGDANQKAIAKRISRIIGYGQDKPGGKEGEGGPVTPGGRGGGGPEVPGGGNTYIGTVTVDARSTINDDPARIAMGWEQAIDELSRYPRQAKRQASPLLG